MIEKNNTKRKATFHFLITKNKEGLYTAYCVELSLIREGKDPLRLRKQIVTLAMDYHTSVVEHNLSDDLLNQLLSKKRYLKVYKALELFELQRKWGELIRKELLIFSVQRIDGKTVYAENTL